MVAPSTGFPEASVTLPFSRACAPARTNEAMPNAVSAARARIVFPISSSSRRRDERHAAGNAANSMKSKKGSLPAGKTGGTEGSFRRRVEVLRPRGLGSQAGLGLERAGFQHLRRELVLAHRHHVHAPRDLVNRDGELSSDRQPLGLLVIGPFRRCPAHP